MTPLLIEALADRYRIERELGTGGMATVYAAHDVKHDRVVALKVLRPEIGAMLGSERFLREIRVAAGLNHPHILPLFDSGDVAGFLFYAMPLVSGGSLRTKLDREGQLSVQAADEIARDIAAALDYAHAQGVVHRDIKPENILFHHEQPMLADFGIALAVSESAGPRLTATGLAVGTPQYMSPEQVGGDQAIDARSDVYALGCVLYESLTGEPPFTGRTPMAVMARQVTDPVRPITTVRPDVPEAFVQAVTIALAKTPADRFATAGELARALTGAGPAPSAPSPAPVAGPRERREERVSLLVMPFENASPDPENEYFSDGLTDELITDLSQVRALRVIARNSSMKLKGTSRSLAQLGRELGVRHILEGSVRRAGDSLRITAQLVDARDESSIWAEKFSGTLENVFDFQEEVSRSIVGALNLELGWEEEAAVSERRIPNLFAYDYYLRARPDIYAFDRTSIERAIRNLEEGHAILGSNVPLLRGLGMAHFQLLNAGVSTEDALIGEVDRYAARIRDIDADAADSHLLAGLAHVLKGDTRKAVLELLTAHSRDSADPDTMLWLGVAMLSTGQPDHARTIIDELVRIDPLAPLSHLLVGYTAFFQGRFEDGIPPLRRSLELDPDVPVSLWCAVRMFIAAGHPDDALHAALSLRDKHPETPFAETAALFAAVLEDRAAAADPPSEELRQWATRDCEWGQCLSDAYAFSGREREALAWLETSVDAGFLNHAFLAEHDPFVAPMRDSPRFRALLGRVASDLAEFERKLETAGVEPARDSNGTGAVGKSRLSRGARHVDRSAPSVRPTHHTVGRDGPLRELEDAFGVVVDGRGTMVTVSGEAGIGKTTVVERFLGRVIAEDDAVWIARGQCSERLAGAAAYLAILEALENLLAADADGELATRLADRAPRWRAEMDGTSRADVTAPVSQERLKLEFARFLEETSRARPVILCIEDIHWADLSTVDLLAYLADRFERLRLMVLVTTRPEDLKIGKHPFQDLQLDLVARGVCRLLDLPLLAAEDVRLYLDLEFPAHQFPAFLAELIHESTEGSPLFMVDLVRHFRDKGVLRKRSGSWALVQAITDLKRQLPGSVRSMIERKIGRLSDEERRLLAAASVHGFEFDSVIVSRVLDLDPADVEEKLEPLATVHGLVDPIDEQELPDGTLTARYRFVHVLYQNALFDSLAPSRRTAWCRTIGGALREHHAGAVDAIASQLAQFDELAREYRGASSMYLTAARATSRISANHEAVRLADRGLQILAKLGADEARDRLELDLQATRGPALMLSQGYAADQVLVCYSRARELAARVGDDRAVVAAFMGLFLHSAISGDLLRALDLAHDALALAQRSGSPELILPARQILFSAQLWHGDFTEALENAERNIAEYDRSLHAEIARVIPQDSGEAAYVFGAYAHWYLGHLDRYREWVDRGIAHSEALGHVGSLAEALSFECGLAVDDRDAARARATGTRLLDLAEEHGLPDRIRFARFTLAAANVLEGNPAQGIDALRSATDDIAGQWTLLLPLYRSAEADALLWAGRYEKGLAVVEAAMAIVERTGERGRDADLQRLRGDLLAAIVSRDGDPAGERTAEAFACYTRALEIARTQKARIFELRAATGMARLARGTGREAEAMAQLADVYGWFAAGHEHVDLVAAAAVLASGKETEERLT